MKHDIRISPLTRADIHAAFALATETPRVHGVLLWHSQTAYASGHKAMLDGELVGFVLGIVHVESAWINELYVRPTWMVHGVGTALVQAQLRWAAERGAGVHSLVALPGTEHYFERFGLRATAALLEYSGGTHIEASHEAVVPLEPQHLLGLCHLDRRASGDDRSRWLREHSDLGMVYTERHHVRGFLLPLAGHGLIVADHPDVGLELQRWLLPLQGYVRLPVGSAAHPHLVEQGYRTEFMGTIMRMGRPVPNEADRLYATP